MSSNFANRRRRLAESQNWRCCWCQCEMITSDAKVLPPNAATIEHVIPKAYNGKNKRYNLVAACAECNQRRGDSIIWQGIVVTDLVKGVWSAT